MFTKYFKKKQNKEIVWFIKHRKNFLIPFLSIYGSLDYLKIKKIQSIINWESRDFIAEVDDEFGLIVYPELKGISDNTSIQWALELIDQFKEKWNWGKISRNVSLNWWSESLLKYFEDKWDWIELSDNTNLNLNIYLIEKFKSKWNWQSSNFHREGNKINIHMKMITGICGNRSINWDYEKISKFHDLIDWHALSLNPNINFISNIPEEKCIYGTELGLRDAIEKAFSVCNEKGNYEMSTRSPYYNLLNVFDKWNFKSLSHNPSIGKMIHLKSESIIIEFLNSYDWDWSAISKNPSIPWTYKIIDRFKDRIDWESFSQIKNFAFSEYDGGSWSIVLIDKYKDKLSWTFLSSNPSLPWSLDFIDYYKDLWNWQKISKNDGIPWSKEILIKYENKLDWSLLSEYAVPWDRKLSKIFNNKIDWKKMGLNARVKWSIPMLKEHYEDLQLEYIFSSELETPLTWDVYRFYLKDQRNDQLILLQNIHFCETFIKPLIDDNNYEIVLNEHLDLHYHRFREDGDSYRYSLKR